MAKASRDPEQVYRIDGRNVFCEVMASGLGIDKALVNFVEYNTAAAQGQRIKGSVGFYMPIITARRLSQDILSGRIARMGKAAREEAKKANNQYPRTVFEQLGGRPSAFTNGGPPIARSFTIAPGSNKPWVLCAKEGPGHETKEGLIVMDKCETTIRVAVDNDKLKEFAIALQTLYDVWVQLRFVPVVAPKMQLANDQRQDAVNKRKAASSNAGQNK